MKDIKDYFKLSPDVNSSKSLSQDDPNNQVPSGKQDFIPVKTFTGHKSEEIPENNKKPFGCATLKEETALKKKSKKTANKLINVNDRNLTEESDVESKNEISDADSPTAINEKEHFENSDINLIENVSKPNAFQFLMNSRNKVIGSNSNGKELSDKEKPVVETPRKLTARKRLLQEWADSVKASKRKIDDEEIETSIKVKLGVRKKRFKALLNIEDSSNGNSGDTGTTELFSKEDQSENKSPCRNYGKILDKKVSTIKKTVKGPKLVLKNKDNSINNSSPNKKTGRIIESSEDDFENDKNNDSSHDAPISGIKINKKKFKHCKELSDSIPHVKSTDHKKCWKMRIKLNTEIDNKLKQSSESGDDIGEVLEKEKNVGIKHNIVNINKVVQLCEGSETGNTESRTNAESFEYSQENRFKRVLRNRSSLQKAIMFSSESSDESIEEKGKPKKKSLKVAPVFVKAVPKPKINEEVLEARRKFLMSDIPETLRKKIERQESCNLQDFDVFPKISHIYQKQSEPYWNLSDVNLFKKELSDFFKYIPEELTCTSLIDHSTIEDSKFPPSEPIQNIKPIIRKIKEENVDYPVYKFYRILKEKLGILPSKNTPKRKSKSRKSPKRKCDTDENKLDEKCTDPSNNPEYMTWTEKYKPRNSEELIGNCEAVSTLKNWLEKWQETFKNGKQKRNYSSDSESDFLSSDADSLADYSSLKNTTILTGPLGSGKSSSIYAICEELGFKVIELNASSKRTGKQVLQELQEATQSHQVRKNKDFLSFAQKKNILKEKIEKEKTKSKKFCVLLIEDVDIIFEQDEGFIAAISQIAAISKRPIILTTSNKRSIYSQKLIKEFKSIEFHSLSVRSMGIWLQILCLIEGVFVDFYSIGELLEYNRGDVRKTILQLQYWVQSGGQRNQHKNITSKCFEWGNEESYVHATDDEVSNISLKDNEEKVHDIRTHVNLVSEFEIFKLEQYYNLPIGMDLKTLWWNIPRVLNMESCDENIFQHLGKSKSNISKLKQISDMYDSICACDISYTTISYKYDTHICSKMWNNSLQDSSEVGSTKSGYSSNVDFLFDWNHYMVDRCLNVCKQTFIKTNCENWRIMNMGLPGMKQLSKEAKMNQFEVELMKPVPFFSNLDRKSVTLDYLPTLRNMARSEKDRAEKNMKRHNRFYNYLRNYNINCNDSVLNHASTTLLVKYI